MNGIPTSLGGHRPRANPCPIADCAGRSDDLRDASAPGTVGSIRRTLAHVLATEEGDPAGHESTLLPGRDAVACRVMDDLRTRPARKGRRVVSPVERTEGDPEVRGEWRGGPIAQPTPVVVLPIINHAGGG